MKKLRVKISDKRVVTVREFTAKDGLNIIVALSKIIDSGVPYLSLLNDKSTSVRLAAVSKFISINEKEVIDIIYKIVTCSTDIPIELIEKDYTIEDMTKLLYEALKINNWDNFWKAAYTLRIVEDSALISWAWSGISKLKV